MKINFAVIVLFVLLTCTSNKASAGLILTIDTLTNSEFSFTISGAFDQDVIGDQKNWLAIKYDWANNYGVHTEWVGSFGTYTGALYFDGALAGQTLGAFNANYTDSIYWSSASNILAGTTVNATYSFTGGSYQSVDENKLQLVSGFDNPVSDWARLEADANSTDVPEPSTLAIFALGMIGLASRRFKKQS
jgi:hypothetical protein